MKKIITVKNIHLGEGKPKICVPLVGTTQTELKKGIENLKNIEFDLVEWRMDYYEHVHVLGEMQDTLSMLQQLLPDCPILTTFRSQKEGGECEISSDYYVKLNKAMITAGADLIDVELFSGDSYVSELIHFAHEHETKVVVSSHDFEKTPSEDELIKRLKKMQKLGADLPKIAVMPRQAEDVLTLLFATQKMASLYADRPIITMSMGKLGLISRLCGETFGSALTFGSAQKASAPGQIPATQLNHILDILHEA